MAVSRYFCAPVGALLAWVPVPSWSQTLSPNEETIVVSAGRIAQRGFDAPAAINATHGAEIHDAGLGVNISDPLLRIPGVFALDRQNYAQDQQLSIRGFGSRSAFGVRGVRLIVDGIPATMPDGQGQVSAIDVAGAERIEVLRGPLAQLYGNAAGGVIQVFSGIGGPDRLSTSVDTGSFDTQRYEMRLRGETANMQGMAAISRFDTGGWREHSDARRNLFNSKLQFALSPTTQATLVGNSFDQPYAQDPLGVTRAQYGSDPHIAPAVALSQDTRKTVRQNQGGIVVETRLNALQSISGRIYYGERDLFQALAISSGGIVDLDRNYGGTSLQFNQKSFLFDSVSLILGVEADGMRETRRGYVNNGGDRGALTRDEDDKVWNTDLFAQLSWQLAKKWQAIGGIRSSIVRFDVDDHYIVAGNPDDSGDVRYTAISPVVGLTYQATETLNLYANYGRGFETPSFAELAYRSSGPGVNFDLRPAHAKHAEIGMKYWPYSGHEFELALFQVKTDDELVVDTSVGGRTTYRNANKTQRYGLELSYTGEFVKTLNARLAWTELNARFDSRDSNDGNYLPGAPNRQLFASLRWQPELTGAFSGFSTSLEAVHLGKIYVDDANSDSTSASTRFNLHSEIQKTYGPWTLGSYVRVNNLSDKRYVGSVIVNQSVGRFFEPAPGRNWMLGFSAEMAL